jgi:hypothetical protein
MLETLYFLGTSKIYVFYSKNPNNTHYDKSNQQETKVIFKLLGSSETI